MTDLTSVVTSRVRTIGAASVGGLVVRKAVRSSLATVARVLNTQVADRAHELEDIFLEKIPEVHGDEAIQELMVASTAANLSVMFDALQHGIEVDHIDVPAAAAAYAQRFTQRGLPLEALLRAYRLGEHRFIQWFVRDLARLSETPDELQAAVDAIVEFTVQYIDRISEALIDIYADEQRLWSQRTDAARSAQVRAVLYDDAMDAATAEIMTGVAMNQWHVALVAWVEADRPHAERLAEAAMRTLRRTGGHSRLVVPTDARTLWAWVSAPSPTPHEVDGRLLLGDDCPGIRIAVGEPGQGLSGFRESHREALRARNVAQTALPPAGVTRFGDVRLSAMLAENVADLRTWVARTLGELAGNTEDMARLRETLRLYLATGTNTTETANRLHIHRNTVRYRLQRAEEIRGRPLTDDRIDVEVSLVVCAQLGASVLH